MQKRLKQAAVAALALCLLALCGCGGGNDEPTVTTTTAASTTVVTTTTQHGVLDTGGLRVRSGPGFEYDEIGGMNYQEDVVILDRVGDWYMIRFGDGVGYINAHYVDMDDAPNASEMAATLPTAAPTTTTTKPASTTTKAGGTTTTAAGGTAANTTAPTKPTAAGIPDTAVDDAY